MPIRTPITALPQHIHLLGLGGAGVSAAARILVARGYTVTGHDRVESELLSALGASVTYSIGPSVTACLAPECALVARSAAVPEDDPQVLRARELALPVIKYSELLARLVPQGTGLAVSGTHGKTTTSWMLWHALYALSKAGYGRFSCVKPSALVGGLNPSVPDSGPLGSNAVVGGVDGWFAVEACEYDRSFLELAPFGAIITNVESDHLDCYGTFAAIEAAFGDFLKRTDRAGLIVLGKGIPAAIEAAAHAEVWRLGRDLFVDDEGPISGRRRFTLRGPGWATPPVHLAVPGSYNVENATVALGLAIGLALRGMPREQWDRIAAVAASGVMEFVGASRRFESWGIYQGVDVIHDYAHHPTELAALLCAAREAFPNRSLCFLFQPHQVSRTARLLSDFAEVLAPCGQASGTYADSLVVAPVYGARRHIDGAHTAGALELAAAVRALGGEAQAAGSRDEAMCQLIEAVGRSVNPVVFVVGAGDIEQVRAPLVAALLDLPLANSAGT